MATETSKGIRSVQDNPAGKVVSDAGGTRWEWNGEEEDPTTLLLRRLNNDELSLEKTNIARPGAPRKREAAAKRLSLGIAEDSNPDAGGGFNPYNSSGKPPRRR
jgi:hypothetical protein